MEEGEIILPRGLSGDFNKMRGIIKKKWGDSEKRIYLLRSYASLLYGWSGRMNLISPKDRYQLATKHFLPALAMAPVVESLPHEKVLDFGSGGGLPGIPLKIMLPETDFILLESRRRRANFLREVVRKLGLKGVEVVNERLGDWNPKGVDLIVSRAVGKPEEVFSQVSPYLHRHGGVLVSLSQEGKPERERGKPPFLLKKKVCWDGGETWMGLLGCGRGF